MITLISGLVTAFIVTPLPPPAVPTLTVPVKLPVSVPNEVEYLKDMFSSFESRRAVEVSA